LSGEMTDQVTADISGAPCHEQSAGKWEG
jgi:hypothetical protein